MDIINEVISLTPVAPLATACRIFKHIWDLVERVQESKRHFRSLAWTIAEFLKVLNSSITGRRRVEDISSTSSTIIGLQRLLDEIRDFIKAEGHGSFLTLMFTKEARIAQIDGYQKKIATLVNTFQISALLDLTKWQARNVSAKDLDQQVLYEKLDDLERNQENLRECFDAQREDVMVIMVALQKRLSERRDGDRERQFFSKSVTYLQTASGRSVELQDWMVTSFEVQFMPRCIGSGGFGEVRSGRWQQMDVALKVLKNESGITPSSMMLEREINIWSRLRHPHILQFLGANVWGDKPFIVMPYMRNGNAREYLVGHPNSNRAEILHQASLGLAYLHGKYIVHADVKGTNILIDNGGTAVLCDFGLSRLRSDVNSRTRVAANTPVYGSIYWMAPERLSGGPLQTPSDIYSFGMMIYELFTDDIPLADVPLTQFVADHKVRPGRPSGAAHVFPYFTDKAWMLAEKCWADDPSERPSAYAVCEALGQISSENANVLSAYQAQVIRDTVAAREARERKAREAAAHEAPAREREAHEDPAREREAREARECEVIRAIAAYSRKTKKQVLQKAQHVQYVQDCQDCVTMGAAGYSRGTPYNYDSYHALRPTLGSIYKSVEALAAHEARTHARLARELEFERVGQREREGLLYDWYLEAVTGDCFGTLRPL
ncbi:kinase-like protein [Athelia psychrophila]|uniref:Kinase-like protein n=1 Tax=Athelia psychrophila TaxID=1759441 RepID=A0A166P8N5_9AGAM|nr:kinase-like protein [Fibularhizoctonia sp. CBS 109695]